jgi:hypothetical protein
MPSAATSVVPAPAFVLVLALVAGMGLPAKKLSAPRPVER